MSHSHWEAVTEERTTNEHIVSITTRLVVPGGWLYRTVTYGYGYDEYLREGPIRSTAMVFVPDAQVAEAQRKAAWRESMRRTTDSVARERQQKADAGAEP